MDKSFRECGTLNNVEYTIRLQRRVRSNQAGRSLSDAIFTTWKEKGFISDFKYAGGSGFTNQSEHRLTLSESQFGDPSIVAQVFSGLTLFLIPYTVDTQYDMQYVHENTRTGARFSAEVDDSFHTTVELLLFLAVPFSTQGVNKTWNRWAITSTISSGENVASGREAS